MSFQLFSQRDPRWANHVLGWGPALGTIGQYGCLDTVFAMIAWDSYGDTQYDPATIDELFTAKQIFVRESTGTYDLLPDNALTEVWPDRFVTTYYAGFRGDLIDAAMPTPDTYSYVYISTASVPSHFVLMFSTGPNYLIADPWTGKTGTLAGYGGSAAVRKTVLVKKLALPSPNPQPPQPVYPKSPDVLMYDSTSEADIPTTAPAVMVYLDGAVSKWPDDGSARFPGAYRVGITVMGDYTKGDLLDVENGDATPDYAPGWVDARRKAGHVNAGVYMSASAWPTVQQAFKTANVPEPPYFVAAWDNDPTIPTGAIGKQYANPSLIPGNPHYDMSAVNIDWLKALRKPIPNPIPEPVPDNVLPGLLQQILIDLLKVFLALIGRTK